MHLRQLQLRLDSCARRQGGVADDVSQGLSLGLVLFEDFALGVVADDFVVDEAADVQLRGAEGREFGHDGG